MGDVNDDNSKLGKRSPLGVQRTIETGKVKQSFSHGRSNTVIVETKKARTFLRPGDAEPTSAASVAPVRATSITQTPAASSEIAQERQSRLLRKAEDQRTRALKDARHCEAGKIVVKSDKIAVPLSPTTLDKLSQAMPQMRELARFAGGPRYEAYFSGGKAAQVTKAGNLSIVQHDGKKITETAKLRNLRPGQLVNLGFSFVTMVVGMEHMARIDRQLARLNEKMDEITAMLVDELAAPVRDIAGSMHRFTIAGVDGVPRDTAEGWVRDLRRVRQRLIAKVERLPNGIQPSTSFWWSSQLNDLRMGAAQMSEAGRFIELLAASDAMLHRMAVSLDAPWALDGVDSSVVTRLASNIARAANELMSSTDKDCSYDKTGKLQLERDQALGDTQRSFGKLIAQLKEAEVFRDIAVRLMDENRQFCLMIEHDRVVGLSEVCSASNVSA